MRSATTRGNSTGGGSCGNKATWGAMQLCHFRHVDMSSTIYNPGSQSMKISSFGSHTAPKIQYRDTAKIKHTHTV